MKNKCFPIALIVSIFLFHLLAAAEGFNFLSHEQFQSLTVAEKKLYILEVRNISLQFEEHLSSRSSQNAKWSLLLNSLSSEAEAATNSEQLSMPSSYSTTSDVREENARIGHAIDLVRNNVKFYKDHKGQWTTDGTRQNSIEKINDTLVRIENLVKLKLDSEQARYMKSNITEVKEIYEMLASIEPEVRPLKSRFDQLTVANSISKKSPKKEVIVEKPILSDSPVIPVIGDMKCIYAGFIIKKNKCEAPKILPEDFSLNGIAKEFKCDSAGGSVLCNPLIFGMQNAETAYCVQRSAYASRDCSRAADNLDNVKRLLKLWSDPTNKKIIEDYQSDLEKLCDDRVQKSQDILKTCKVVQQQFKQKVQAEIITMSGKRTEIKLQPGESVRRDQ